MLKNYLDYCYQRKLNPESGETLNKYLALVQLGLVK